MRFTFLMAVFMFASNLFGLSGKVADGVYKDPSGWYSIKIPSGLINPQVDDHITDEYTILAVLSDFGDVYRAELMKFDPSTSESIFPKIKEDGITFLKMSVTNPLDQQGLKYHILHTEALENEEFGQLYYLLIKIENASTVLNANTNTRGDSYRGFLLSFDKNNLVNLCTQYSPIALDMLKKMNRDAEIRETLLNNLLEFRRGYKSLTNP